MSAENSDLFSEALKHFAQGIALLAQAGGAPSGDSSWPASMLLKDACKYLSMGETKFREEITDGAIPEGKKIGGRPHWLRTDLDDYLRRKFRE